MSKIILWIVSKLKLETNITLLEKNIKNRLRDFDFGDLDSDRIDKILVIPNPDLPNPSCLNFEIYSIACKFILDRSGKLIQVNDN